MRLTRNSGLWLLVFSVALTAFSPSVGAAEGRIIFVSGSATIERGADRIPARKETLVQTGDVIVTGGDGRVQWRMSDDSHFILRPNTRFKVADFQPQTTDGGGGKAFYELLSGAFRTVTGLIGKQNQASYQVMTPVATLGIRGTDYSAVMCQDNCQWAQIGGAEISNGLYIRVDTGSVLVSNKAGSLEVKAGQYAYVADENTAPVLLTEVPAVFVNWASAFEFRVGLGAEGHGSIRIEGVDLGTPPSPN